MSAGINGRVLHDFILNLTNWYLSALKDGGYPLVALLMAVESSIIPLPSEFIIPPAAHLAHTEGTFSMAGLIIAGAVGSWVGASIMYWISRVGGRPFLLRFGKYFFISPEKIHGAERWAQRFGPGGILVARFLPVVRHLIGIPAGLVKMDFKLYSIHTLIGSAGWSAVLCWLGVKFGQDDQALKGNVLHLSLWCGGILLVLGLLYYFLVHRHMKAEAAPKK